MSTPVQVPQEAQVPCDAPDILARVLLDLLTVEDAAVLLDAPASSIEELLADAETAAAAARLAVQMRTGGEFVEERAAALLPAFVDRLETILRDADASPRSAIEAGRELVALAGAKARVNAKINAAAGLTNAGGGPLFNIILSPTLPHIPAERLINVELDDGH